MDILFPTKRILNLGGHLVRIDEPKVMGILNLTEDSFFDGGRHNELDKQLAQTEHMLDEGAFFIDIGAQSTRPGAKQIGVEEELKILRQSLPELIRAFPEAHFSLDTYHAEVARYAIDQGVQMINDISGGLFDNEMLKAIAELKVPYVMMHTGGTPETMQNKPEYDNIIKSLLLFFSEQMYKARQLGINDILIDPGFGFGKTLEHNYHVLNHLRELRFTEAMIVAGISRKSMIQKVIEKTAEEALNGTTALHMIALQNGADILRVHDVAPAVECIKLHCKLQSNT